MSDPHELIAKADKKIQGGGGIMSLFSGPKFDSAQELYLQAANAFKLVKDWQSASDQFLRCAFCAEKQGNMSEVAQFYQSSGDCLKKVNLNDAIIQYEKAVKIWQTSGRFNASAKLLKSVAEAKEAEGVTDDTRDAVIDLYSRAADLFEMEDFGKTMYSACILKVAEQKAYAGQHHEALSIFEAEAQKSLGNNLLQYGAKEHLLKAGILHMVIGDGVTTKLALERYSSMDPRFDTSREGQLFAALVDAIENQDIEEFENKLYEYDSISKLDAWKTTFLLKVKQTLSGADLGGGMANSGDPAAAAGDFDLT